MNDYEYNAHDIPEYINVMFDPSINHTFGFQRRLAFWAAENHILWPQYGYLSGCQTVHRRQKKLIPCFNSAQFYLNVHMEAETKWAPFRRQYFHMHQFRQWLGAKHVASHTWTCEFPAQRVSNTENESHLATQLILEGSFRLCNWLSLRRLEIEF